MEQHNITSIEELLPRYCEGMATEEECQRVETWINQAAENEKLVKQIHTLYLATDTMTTLAKVDTEKALRKVKGKIKDSRMTTKWEWAQRVAAVLFIPLFITLLVQHFDTEVQEAAQMIEIKTNPGMTTSFVLPDSTVVYLNSESFLQYPSRFTGDTREVKLKGEAYFDVTKDAKKRFVVSTTHYSRIEVLGTSFNLEAYEEDTAVLATLVEGSVNFSFTKNGKDKCISMAPGQKMIYNSRTGTTQLLATPCAAETAWKDGQIVFLNTPLTEALHMLEKRYNVAFRLKNNRLKENYFTGTFTSQRLERILEYFKISSNIRWRYIDSPDMTEEKTKIEIY